MFELDALLDTRLGTIRKMGVEHAERVLTQQYLTRESDDFEGISRSTFKELYRQRDVETLKYSTITALVPQLKDLTTFLAEMAITRPYFDGIEIAVNLWPYKLSQQERKDLGDSVSAWTGGLVPVKLINIKPEALTPQLVNAQFAMMFMYDYGNWMDKHSEAFNETRCSEIHLVAPAMYFNEKPDEKTLKELIREAAHPFQAAMMLASPLVGLELIDVKYFSIVKQ